MNKKLLGKLAETRLDLEKRISLSENILKEKKEEYALREKTANRMKLERSRLSLDISLVCSGKEPRHSNKFREKKKITRGNKK